MWTCSSSRESYLILLPAICLITTDTKVAHIPNKPLVPSTPIQPPSSALWCWSSNFIAILLLLLVVEFLLGASVWTIKWGWEAKKGQGSCSFHSACSPCQYCPRRSSNLRNLSLFSPPSSQCHFIGLYLLCEYLPPALEMPEQMHISSGPPSSPNWSVRVSNNPNCFSWCHCIQESILIFSFAYQSSNTLVIIL